MVETELISQDMIELKDISLFQSRLIQLLKSNGPMTRNEICKSLGFEQYNYEYRDIRFRTGTTKDSGSLIRYHRTIKQYKFRTTVYDNVKKLIERKIVIKFSKKNGKRGRPVVLFKLKS